MDEKIFISKQISKYATSGKLIEFIDKLNVPSITNYAHVQASGDKDSDGNTIYSNIGIKMLDYSNGTGEKTISVEANISSDDLLFILNKVKIGLKNFQLPAQDKIFGKADKDGRSKVTKLTIKREQVNSKGEEKKYPWFVEIENGTGVKASNTTTGGTYIKPKTYHCDAKVNINLSDLDMFSLLTRVESYVRVWELAFAARNVRQAREYMIAASEANKK